MPMRSRPLLAVLPVLLAACGTRRGDVGCGLASVAGPSLMLEEFTRPGKTLATAPDRLPERLAVRIALGPALGSVVGRTDSALVIGLEGQLPPTPEVGFGVLVVDSTGTARGVVLYQGNPLPGAPLLGKVNNGTTNLPLIGLRTDPALWQDKLCPLFPDSLNR